MAGHLFLPLRLLPRHGSIPLPHALLRGREWSAQFHDAQQSGRNLSRNNGDGTFTDVASEAGVEDIGAGMSVSWLDFDNDGREDLYVADMWTAAGIRISTQDNFRHYDDETTRALYHKHALGN